MQSNGRSAASPSPCNFPGCQKRHWAKGWCDTHYAQSRTDKKLRPIKTIFDPITYQGAHSRLKWLWGPAKQYPCIVCGKRAANWAYDGTDPDQLLGKTGETGHVLYSRYPEFYKPMCHRCHSIEDRTAAAQELREYREWKIRTGLTLADLEEIQLPITA